MRMANNKVLFADNDVHESVLQIPPLHTVGHVCDGSTVSLSDMRTKSCQKVSNVRIILAGHLS